MDIKAEDLTWQNIHEMIHDGKLFVRGLCGGKTHVSTFAIHESVYQMMVGLEQKREMQLNTLLNLYGNTMILKEQLGADLNSGKITFEQKLHEVEGLILNIKSQGDANKINFANLNQANAAGTFLYKDIFIFAEKNGFEKPESEVFRALTETENLLETMQAQNLVIRPTISSREDAQAKDTVKFLRELADVVSTIKGRWDEDDVSIKAHREVKEWQEINLSDIKLLCSEGVDEECYDYFCGLIKGQDKLIIRPDSWCISEDDELYEQLADILRYSLNKDVDLHILNQ